MLRFLRKEFAIAGTFSAPESVYMYRRGPFLALRAHNGFQQAPIMDPWGNRKIDRRMDPGRSGRKAE